MPANRKLLLLPGDGIGPEVMRQVGRVVEWYDRRHLASFDVSEDLVGGCAIDKDGTPLTDATMRRAMEADAVLLGAVGGPKWDRLPFAQKPERGAAAAAKGHGPVRQSAAGAGVPAAPGRLDPEARGD